MESLDLGTLIVAGICGIGAIQLIMWIVVVIRHHGYDDLRLDLTKAESSPSNGTPGLRRSHSARTSNSRSPLAYDNPVKASLESSRV